MSDRYAKYEGHTPGPWTKSERDPFGDYAVQGPEGGLAIAAVCNGSMRMMGGREREHDANAALVTDAPTLLAENKRMLEALEFIARSAEAGTIFHIQASRALKGEQP